MPKIDETRPAPRTTLQPDPSPEARPAPALAAPAAPAAPDTFFAAAGGRPARPAAPELRQPSLPQHRGASFAGPGHPPRLLAASSAELADPVAAPLQGDVVRLGDYSGCDPRLVAGVELAKQGRGAEAVGLFAAVAGMPAVPPAAAGLQEACARALRAAPPGDAAADVGESLHEVALALASSAPTAAIEIYEALRGHRELLYPLTRFAPDYNLACLLSARDPAPAAQGRALRLVAATAQYSAQQLRAQPHDADWQDDVRETAGLLRRTDAGMQALHRSHGEALTQLAGALEGLLAPPAAPTAFAALDELVATLR